MRKSKLLSMTILVLVFCFVLSAGLLVVSAEGTCEGQATGHTPGEYLYEADYNTCTGGYKVAYYQCQECWASVDAEGNGVAYEEGTGKHQVGMFGPFEANYSPCEGGFKVT